HQDARVYLATLRPGDAVEYPASGRHLWLQVLRGKVAVGEHVAQAGDGSAVSDEAGLSVAAVQPAEIMLFDLA
ncbi:MAG TPA: pirin family protein, partial [Pirellulales bacterium]|nr:pirin family protein [Pirellulales bacterium]